MRYAASKVSRLPHFPDSVVFVRRLPTTEIHDGGIEPDRSSIHFEFQVTS